MRWEAVFEDIEAEWASVERGEIAAEAAELTRAEWAALTLADRLRGARGGAITLHLAWGERCSLRLSAVGEGWLGGETSDNTGLVVPLAAVAVLDGDLSASAGPPSSASPVSLAAALRRITRIRATVAVVGAHGTVLGEGTMDRVGRDHFDLVRHAPDEARRRGQVTGALTVPFSGLGLIRIAPRRHRAL